MKQHKWHKEIHAYAEGAEIEYKELGGVWIKDPDPQWNEEDHEFRIKPQQQQPQYLYVYSTSKGYQFALKHGAVEVGSLNEIANCIGKIKLEAEE